MQDQGINPGTRMKASALKHYRSGLLLYVALPSLDDTNWWEGTQLVPFVVGSIALGSAIVAPKRWCEALLALFP